MRFQNIKYCTAVQICPKVEPIIMLHNYNGSWHRKFIKFWIYCLLSCTVYVEEVFMDEGDMGKWWKREKEWEWKGKEGEEKRMMEEGERARME
jgi:hypothetical protein